MAKNENNDKVYDLEIRTTSMEIKFENIDKKLDTVLGKLNGFFESGINLKNLEKEFEKMCLRNETEHKSFVDSNFAEHKNFTSKVGFTTASVILGIIIVAIGILNYFLGR